MNDNDHLKFKYSATCHTNDLRIVHCLRSLCEYNNKAKGEGKPMIGWGGTKGTDWEEDGHCITLRFREMGYREEFLKDADELLNKSWHIFWETKAWKLVGTDDNNPATRQRDIKK